VGTTDTTADHITATLQLAAWLPANQSCVDVSQRPGFRLVMYDGVNPPLDSADPDTVAIIAEVGTGPDGQINSWFTELNSQSQPEVGLTVTIVMHTMNSLPQIQRGCTLMPEVDERASKKTVKSFPEGTLPDISEGSVLGTNQSWNYLPSEEMVDGLLDSSQLGLLPKFGHNLVDHLQDVVADLTKKRNDICRDVEAIDIEVAASVTKFSSSEIAFIHTTLTIIASTNHCK
jgi:hypothetical protein